MSEYYNDDLSWEALARNCHDYAFQLVKALNEGLNSYNEWQSFRAGRTNAQIATALSKTETQISELDSAYSAMKSAYDYANNQTPSQSDYFYSLRKFS